MKIARVTGFYTADTAHGYRKLGFAWEDKDGTQRYIEANYLESDPLMAADFMEMFAAGIRKRIKDGVDKR